MDGTHRRARLARSRLYLVLEARPHGGDPSPLLDAALRGGVDVVQLRDKELTTDDLVAAAEPFRRLCAAHGALFVLNDRPELVERCGADGVHVGQSDGSVDEARRTVGRERLVGLSVSTAGELEAADGDADYLGVGAVYGTPTKTEAEPAGLELVRLARDTVRKPWFAIGGVELDTVEEVALAGAPGIAVVRAIRDADDPEAAARALREPLPPAQAVVAGPEERDRGLLPQLELAVVSIAPGEGIGPHTHRVHADVFYVLDGELDLRLGDGTVRVPSGSCVTAPPGLVHGFRNRTDREVRYLNLHAPGVWARGHAAGADPATFDVFGIEEAPPDLRGDVSGPGDGDRLTKEHRLLLVRSSRPELDVLELLVGAEHTGAGPHVHLRQADCFYVLEGELDVLAGDETVRVGPGGSVVVPPGVVHAFTSVGRARFLNVHAPSCGFVEYLRRADAGEQVDSEQYDQYGVTRPAG
ncbi:MAG: thiamine-phosphate pyrophosphorylase [Gaiellaceae bacterium]|nr:thiamine-phosphate pyrophosphorylase [Gaiellaceae bacterium]